VRDLPVIVDGSCILSTIFAYLFAIVGNSVLFFDEKAKNKSKNLLK